MRMDESGPRGEQMLKTGLGRAVFLAIIGLLVMAPMIHDFFTKPESLRPIIGVFGDHPLGLPNPVAGVLALIVLVAPLLGMMSAGFDLMQALRAADGRVFPGAFGLTVAVYRHWRNPVVRPYAQAVLRWLGAFLVVCVAWITATAIAGV